MVLEVTGREIDACYSVWCIFEQWADGSAVLVEEEVGWKEESLRLPVGDWGLFGLLSSYW